MNKKHEMMVYMIPTTYSPYSITDEEFISIAKKYGNEYTLKGFELMWNTDEVNMDTHFIRFIPSGKNILYYTITPETELIDQHERTVTGNYIICLYKYEESMKLVGTLAIPYDRDFVNEIEDYADENGISYYDMQEL